MKLIRPLDLNVNAAYLNLVLLWKCGAVNKLQILNFVNDEFQEYQWIEATNKSLNDIESEMGKDLSEDSDFTSLNIKSRYAPELLQEAETLFAKNQIIIAMNTEKSKKEYLANLETILKDLKNKYDEASSITIYKNEIIMVNCLKKYNHSVYKINSTFEDIFYNIGLEADDELCRYWKVLNRFSSTLSEETIRKISDEFINIVTGETSKSMSVGEKLSAIFKSTLQGRVGVSDIETLFKDMSSMNIVNIMNELIDRYLISHSVHNDDFVNAIVFDEFSAVVCAQSIHQLIVMQKRLLFEILLSVVVLDFEYSILESKLNEFLEIYYKQTLFIRLYKLA